MNIPSPIRYHAASMGLAAYLDDQCVEMHIVTDRGKNITVVCDQNSIFSIQRHIEKMARDCPEILDWKPAKYKNGLEKYYPLSQINKEKVAMYTRAAGLEHLLITWILVADAKQSQLYEYHKIIEEVPLSGGNKHHYVEEKSSHELLPLSNGLIVAEPANDYQLDHNRRGRSSSSNSPTHNTYEPHGKIETELKRRYIELIANTLQKACLKNNFDRLVLVAPGRLVGEIKEQLTHDVLDRLVCTLAKDLAHYHGNPLLDHLHDALSEANIE